MTAGLALIVVMLLATSEVSYRADFIGEFLDLLVLLCPRCGVFKMVCWDCFLPNICGVPPSFEALFEAVRVFRDALTLPRLTESQI